MLTVLLVDDHEVVRAGYRRLLESMDDIKVIAEAKDATEAYQAWLAHNPDVIVMDLHLDGIDGLAMTRRIRSRDEDARILIFSMHENEQFLHRAIEAGAAGYITKRNAASVMIEGVRTVADGESYFSEDMLPFIDCHASTSVDSLACLSPREFEVFMLMAQGYSTHAIANLIHVNAKTAGHHSTRVKSKLGISNVAELTRLAIRQGLIEA